MLRTSSFCTALLPLVAGTITLKGPDVTSDTWIRGGTYGDTLYGTYEYQGGEAGW